MVFSSVLFLYIYLPVVLLIYYITPIKWRNPVLFVANLLFYGWGEPIYVLLMLFSISVNYYNGLLIEKYRDNRAKAKRVLIINIAVNLLMLGFFKYYNLIAETLSLIPFISITKLNVALPIGISFYTFQTMSYTIDLYRGESEIQRNFIKFGTFVALFPQLIAGPIVRYKDVSSQLGFRASSIEQLSSGVRRFTIGLAKKVLIANNIGQLWDIYAANYSNLTFVGSWMGVFAFSLQIFFDFSGYSDMAIGLGKMIGFEFKENFDYPFISKSVTEFWRRWHISLGTWFKDYVYIPLGGNKFGLKRQLINIFIVWSLTGIWHGANWTYLLWGIYYGILLASEKLFLLKSLERLNSTVRHIYVIFAVNLVWPLFQLNSLQAAATYTSSMFGFSPAGLYSANDIFNFKTYFAVFVVGVIACTPVSKNLFNKLPDKAKNILSPIFVVIILILSTAYLVDATYNPFLYFRF
ncbi:MAG: MBOAT family protein [Ruminococcaceae bacterium]|nr:MBOAT family protein [Oscillospiraceae bacterium]